MSSNVSAACVEPSSAVYTNYIHWFLIPAVGALVILSLLERRKSYKLDLFDGRPGAVRPMSFLGEMSNRWGLMFVLGSVTGNIITMTMKVFSVEFPIWAKIFLLYVFCLETSVICYPLFACMTCRHKLVSSILGLCYSCGWLAFQLYVDIQLVICYSEISLYGLTVFIIAVDCPIIVCDVLVVIKFSRKLHKCIRTGRYTVEPEEQSQLCESHHNTYVNCLLRPNMPATSSHIRPSLKVRIVSRFVTNVPGFRFPVTIMGTAFMCLIMLYSVTLGFAAVLHIVIPYIGKYADLLIAGIIIASIATLSIGLRNIYQLIINYRRDMLYLYKGKRDFFIPPAAQSPSPNVYMSRGMRYIGTAIAGMIWGTVVCYLVVFVPTFLMFATFRELINRDKLPDLFKELELLVYPVCMIIVFQLQTLLIGRFLLQEKVKETDQYRPLALDNRNVYNILSFFMMFLNVSIGAFTFLKRILVGSVVGIFLITRMDKCLYMKGFEGMDKCYLNYIGMLMVDFSHNNPIMHVFCSIVKEAADERRDSSASVAMTNPTYGTPRNVPRFPRSPVARRRWWVAYTLINNRQLVADRKGNLPEIQISIRDSPTDVRLASPGQTADWDVKCCSKYKFTIPPNFSTNAAALFVLMSVAFIYVGVSVIYF